MSFDKFLIDKQSIINDALDRYMPSQEKYPQVIFESMRYSIFAGGKRLRPILVLAAYESFCSDSIENVLPVACALEMIHTYSLIHDDLPCMDDDDFRRGKPTNHKVYGEAIAMLAGDMLLTYAFETITKADLESKKIVDIIALITNLSGVNGMAVGQVVDLITEGKEITCEELDFIHKNKTAALINASLKSGAIAAGATEEQIKKMEEYGSRIGLCFQIVDDILDIEGNQELLGKDIGSDVENDKNTYPKLYGLDKSKERAKQLYEEAVSIANDFPNPSLFIGLAEFFLKRVY